MSVVHFLESRGRYTGGSLLARLDQLLDTAELEEIVKPNEWTALKVEVGALGHLGYLRQPLVRAVAERIRALGAEVTVADSSRLSPAGSGVDHEWIDAAGAHGFLVNTLGREPQLADGYTGQEFELLPVEGDELGGAEVGRLFAESKALIVLSHVTAHPFAGLSAAVAGMGLGCIARPGKLRAHAPLKPTVVSELCDVCGACLEACARRAISAGNGAVGVDRARCSGCAYYCTAACPRGALAVPAEAARHFQKRIVEAAGAVNVAVQGKVHFFNFLLDVGPYPDYYPFSDNTIVPDIGILSSRDPVAIDQASVDLIDMVPGNYLSLAEEADALAPGAGKLTRITGVDPVDMLEYGQQFGLGQRGYELRQLEWPVARGSVTSTVGAR